MSLKQFDKGPIIFGFGMVIAALISFVIYREPIPSDYSESFRNELASWKSGAILQQVTVEIGETPIIVEIVHHEREIAVGFTRSTIPGLAHNGTLESMHKWNCYEIGNGVVAVGIQKPYFYSLH